MESHIVEYVGFVAGVTDRRYTLRVRRRDGSAQNFTLAIANEAFLSRRVRYQDAPEICFLRLSRELTSEQQTNALHFDITDADLEEYRVAHTPKPSSRRAKPTPTPTETA